MKKANLIMLGAPGSGKGTRAVALCEVLNVVQVATGDLFRNNIKGGTELGKLAKSYIDKGELVPDEVTASMVKDRLQQPDTQKGFILDGFPRTIKQAEMLESILKELGEEITAVIFLDVPDAEIVKRISGRVICEKCQAPYHKEYSPSKVEGVCDKCGGKLYTRDDDKPETVLNRLEVFRKNTFPLVEFYEKKGLIVRIPPELSAEGAVSDMRKLSQELGLL
ncbi:MAG: adenylate kinase [Verrucomicrobiaceae bacterium]|nr:adenylate kinase [Verrucomicrobiaceae bacterium]